MWNKLGIRSRITAGFVPLIILMALLSYNAVRGLDGVSSLFSSYRSTAVQSLTIGDYSGLLDTIRKATLDFSLKPTPAAVSELQAAVKAMTDPEAKIDQQFADDPTLVAALQGVRADVAAYGIAFDKIVAIEKDRDNLILKVTDFGPWTQLALADMMRSAWRQKDVDALYRIGAVFESVSKSLYFSERFLHDHDMAAYASAQAELKQALDRYAQLDAVLTSDMQRQRANSALGLMTNYGARLADAEKNTAASLAIRTETLDQLGPKMALAFDDLQKRIVDRQRELGPAAEALASSAAVSTLVICGVLIVVGLVLAYFTGKLIAGAVRRMADMMQRIAQGEPDIRVEGDRHRHELGAMARSLLVFQETGRAKIQAQVDAERTRGEIEADRLRREAEKAEDSRQMQQMFEKLGVALNGLSTGDLTVRIDNVDDRFLTVRQQFNQSVGTLESTMKAVLESVASIQSGLSEISDASNDLAHRTEQQAASLEETAAALGEVSNAINTSAAGANRAQTSAATAQDSAEKGGAIVSRAVEAMAEIEGSSDRIGMIIGVIDEIAFQTNLLALNAGVEAARAGDAGRGFAVVAQEVRGLAQRSADAAREIKTLIADSGQHVRQGVDLVKASGNSLNAIVAQVGQVSVVVAEIAASATEQAVSLREVSSAADQMDKIMQQNAAMVEETTAAAQAISAETFRLGSLVARFKTHTSAPASQMSSHTLSAQQSRLAG